MQAVTVSDFQANGSNFFFRRLTGIGQAALNIYSTEWFGFPNNGTGGPNLSSPSIAFTASEVLNLQTETQMNTTNSNAERNPNDFSNVTARYAPTTLQTGTTILMTMRDRT